MKMLSSCHETSQSMWLERKTFIIFLSYTSSCSIETATYFNLDVKFGKLGRVASETWLYMRSNNFLLVRAMFKWDYSIIG